MFTQPSVNQIASAYQGNPAPLARKVDQDKKQNGGIPQDLRQLLALNDITQGRNAMGIQQALQTPTNMPTVAQDLQERARQALQARQMQAMQEMQRKNGQPNLVPPGTPRPPMQAQGLDSLESNVGEEYAHGGIIGDVRHFDDGGKTSTLGNLLKGISDPISNYFREDLEKSEARRKLQEQLSEAAPGLLEQLTDPERAARLKQVQALSGQREKIETGEAKTPYPQGGPAIPGNWDRPTGVADTAREVSAMLRKTPDAVEAASKEVAQNKQPSVANPRVNAPAQTGGITNLVPPAEDTEAMALMKKDMRRDPDAEAAALKAKRLAEVGNKDLSIYDQMAEQLKARKERLNAPKSGYDATMELLADIANSGGRTWMQAGSRGAAAQQARNLSRQEQQDVLMDKILDLGAKKSEALYGEKKEMFDLTQTEKNSVYEKAYQAAKAVNSSDDEAKKIAAQAVENEKNRQKDLRVAQIGAQDRDQLMGRAKALMAADPTKKMTLEEAMKRASTAAGATQMESSSVRDIKGYQDALEKINTRYQYADNKSEYGKRQLIKRDQELADLKALHGIPAQGINTLPSASPSGTVPAVGTVMEGYKFKGGNPRDQNNWEKV